MDSTLVIGHIALIQESKRQDFVLDVISRLKAKGYDVVGLFAGEAREPEFLAELKQKTEKLGLVEQVLFLGRRNDIPALLRIIDVLMIPSSFEGFPLAGLEAAAAGVPVAACNTAGAEEFIRVSGDGVTFEENNASEAVEAVLNIIEGREKMSAAGRSFANQMSNSVYQMNIREIFARAM